jgi:hypothetical protein
MAFEPLDGAWKPAASADLRVPNVLDSVTPNPKQPPQQDQKCTLTQLLALSAKAGHPQRSRGTK